MFLGRRGVVFKNKKSFMLEFGVSQYGQIHGKNNDTLDTDIKSEACRIMQFNSMNDIFVYKCISIYI